MPVVVDVRDDVVGDDVLDGLFDWLRFVDSTFSTYRADSEIGRPNGGDLLLGDASPLVREVLELRGAAQGDARVVRRSRRVGAHRRPDRPLVKG